MGSGFKRCIEISHRENKNIMDDDKDERESELQVGNFLSALYLLFISSIVFLLIFFSDSDSLSLNSLGDFLAGVFSPLAFLWLILGYRQQAKELAYQSKELADTKEQFIEQNRMNALSLNVYTPKFYPPNTEASNYRKAENGSYFLFEYTLSNFGGDLLDIHSGISTPPQIPNYTSNDFKSIRNGESDEFSSKVFLENDRPTRLIIFIYGSDRVGRFFKQEFITEKLIDKNQAMSKLKFTTIPYEDEPDPT